MISLIRRHAAALAVLLAVAGNAVPTAVMAQQDAQKAAPAAPAAGACSRAAAPIAPPAPVPTVTKESVENRTGSSAVAPGGLRFQGHADHPGHHVDGQLVHPVREALGAIQADARRQGNARLLLEGAIAEGRGEAAEGGSAFRYIAETGLDANEHHEGALTENIDLNTWVTMSVQRSVDTVQSRMQDGLAFLATVGSTAPFVGLFGTVWGIYHALTAIGIAGQASIDKVAGPVGEALIMTAIGLAVAVPAVMGYNWLVRRNKVAMDQVRTFGADLHAVLLGRKIELKAAPAR
jgi:biopolymer transport protein ExbB